MRKLLAMAALSALAGACATTPKEPPAPPTEKAEVYRIEIRDQDFTEFTALAHVQLPPGASPTSAHWELLSGSPLAPLASGDSPMAADQVPDDGVVQVGGRAAYSASPEGQAEIMSQEGSMPIVLRGYVEADGVRYAFTRAGRVRTPRVPSIDVARVEAGAIPSERRVGLVFFIRVENPNAFDVPLENVEFDLKIGGVEIDKGIAGTKRLVPRGGAVEIDLPVSLDERNFPEVESYLRGNSELPYEMVGQVRLGMGRIPYELSGPIQIRSSGY